MRTTKTSHHLDKVLLSALLTVGSILAPAWAVAGSGASMADRTARITNGVLTTNRPTTGALLAKSGSAFAEICSGTLVGCHTFVTAAHCVCDGLSFSTCGNPRPGDYAVYLQNSGLRAVKAVRVHPSFAFGLRGDIAVVTLSDDVDGIVPTAINSTMAPPFGTSGAIAGFGLTRAGAGDAGLLREGEVVTGRCDYRVDQANHVCWEFATPVGDPGTDSNTCYGDSGGPLFVDYGAGEVLAGVTSGGISYTCLPRDLSFDTDVYVYRSFLESVAGADLDAGECGQLAPVGTEGAEVQSFSYAGLGSLEKACRQTVTRHYSTYVKGKLAAMQKCMGEWGEGSRPGPCPDLATAIEIASVITKIDAQTLAQTCPSDIVGHVGLSGACASATSTADLAACILESGNATVAHALAAEFADPSQMNVMASAADQRCQKAVVKAGAKSLTSQIRALGNCNASMAAGRAVSCPDARAAKTIAKVEAKSEKLIRKSCSEDSACTLASAGGFRGRCGSENVTAVDDLVEFFHQGHADAAAVMSDVLDVTAAATDLAFEVPEGTEVLTVTMNGSEGVYANDLDLYVRRGAPASTSEFDARSANGGVFEGIRIDNPEPGTWYAYPHRYAGEAHISYQITVTSSRS